MLKMLLEGTFPHMVQLLNAGEVNQKREACFFSNYKVTEEMNQGTSLYKYIFFVFFLYIKDTF